MAARSGNAIVAQGGGPTAVINHSLRGVVSTLDQELVASARVWGARNGILGVLEDQYVELRSVGRRMWKDITGSPAAALGSCRKKLSEEEAERVIQILKKMEVRYFFYIGGNDSMDTALQLGRAADAIGYEIHCAGIPKTIDNDLVETDHCPGFASAARYYAQSAIDLGADLRSLPTPVSILEVMGRNAGWLTAATLVARKEPDDAPHLIYVPERRLARDRFLEDVEKIYRDQGWVIVAVSEGLMDEQGESLGISLGEAARDDFGHALRGDVGASLAQLVNARLGIRARSEKPGLCARASVLLASEVDRSEAEQVGEFGASEALGGETGFMAAIQRTAHDPYRASYTTVALEKVANLERELPAEYLSSEGSDIREEYRLYVEPLLGGPLRRHAHF